jgi:deoxyadenosine/deoxycytidine kinase
MTIKKGYVLVKCACCKTEFQARIADRNRGWGKYCSKKCKAIKQYTAYLTSYQASTVDDVDYEGDGWDAHKDIF